ncbi:MAG: oligosaccharide flippase family protein [Flavobacteriales bacterium]|nr:oligosaccharide flippase family protein [Flavobacteriales bacterium]
MSGMQSSPSHAGERPFLRSVATLFSGTVLAQLFPFLCAPLIARLYDATQFAVFGTLLAVFNIINVVAAGRYEQAIVLPRERGQAADLVKGALVLVACTTVLVTGLLLAFGLRLERAASLTDLHRLTVPLVALTFLGGTQLVLLQWLLRHRAFPVIARQKVLQAVAVTGLTILFGWLAWRNGLVAGYVLGWLIYASATAWAVLRSFPLGPGWHAGAIKAALRAYRDWPLHNAWPAVLNAVASGMAVIYMVAYFDTQVVGEHNFARQYLLVPISMVSVALGQVLFERTASKVREGRPVMADIRRVTWALAAIALSVALVVTLFGESLFALVFGESWRYAGHAAGILIWGYAAQLVGGPLGSQLIAMGKVKAAMAFPVFFAALLALLPFFKHVEPLHFMALLSATEVLAYGGYAAWVWYHAGRHDRSISPTE